MPDLWGNPERKGGSGRIPDSRRDQHKLFQRVNVTIDPETFERLEKFCTDNERARSWAVQKAIREWLESQGY